MAIYSSLRDYHFNDTDIDDIRGAAVYGSDDEKLGKIDDVIFDNRNGELRYVVIDSGGWLTTKKFILPARHLMIREEADKDFHANITKHQVQRLPEYKEKDVESDKDWTDYESRYKSSWADGPILHREGSTHILTPEIVEGSGSGAQVHAQSPKRIAHDLPRYGATSTADTTESASLIGDTDYEPVVSGTEGERKSIGRQIDQPTSARSESDVQGDALKEDNIGQGSIERMKENARIRAFEERLRRDREEIMRRKDRAA